MESIRILAEIRQLPEQEKLAKLRELPQIANIKDEKRKEREIKRFADPSIKLKRWEYGECIQFGESTDAFGIVKFDLTDGEKPKEARV